MAELSSPEDFESWLEGKAGLSINVLALRSALRVLPLLVDAADESVILSGLRAITVSFVAVKYPTKAKKVKLYDAADEADAYAEELAEFSPENHTNYAVRAASEAAWVVAYKSGRTAATSRTAFWAASAVEEFDDEIAIWRELSADVTNLESITASKQFGARQAKALISEKLWSGSVPGWAADYWAGFKRRKRRSEYWQVWIDLYEALQDGEHPWNLVGSPLEEVLMKIALQTDDEWKQGAIKVNSRIKQWIDEANPKQSRSILPLFFISYSSPEEKLARVVGNVLEQAGYSYVAQYKDMPAGSNFPIEMRKALEIVKSGRMIALLSPAYIDSKHCQAEWAAAYNLDPDGAKRKLVPLLVTKTELPALYQTTVYRSLVDLGTDAERAAILDAIQHGSGRMAAMNGLHSPTDFDWTRAGKMRAVAGAANAPILQSTRSKQNHANRLTASRFGAQTLLDKVRAQSNYSGLEDFVEALKGYIEHLPEKTARNSGNMHFADNRMRMMRTLAESSWQFMSNVQRAEFLTLYQEHVGLRVYYPEIPAFYEDVNNGQENLALPFDAFEKFEKSVVKHTPKVFDPTIPSDIGEVGAREADIRQSVGQPEATGLPPDPLGTINAEKARSYGIGATINQFWKVFLNGEKVVKSGEAWGKAYEDLAPHVKTILEWAREFMNGPPS